MGHVESLPIEQRRDRIIGKLKRLADRPDDRYRFLIDLGRKLPAMDPQHKLDDFLVPGCISKVWLFPQITDSCIHFHADADAAIPKGIVALILEIYNDESYETITQLDTSFVKELEVGMQLSFNRRNSISNFIGQIRQVATALSERHP